MYKTESCVESWAVLSLLKYNQPENHALTSCSATMGENCYENSEDDLYEEEAFATCGASDRASKSVRRSDSLSGDDDSSGDDIYDTVNDHSSDSSDDCRSSG